MHIPKAVVVIALAAMLLLTAWTVALATDRNPLPFPDGPYAVFTTPTPTAMSTIIELLGEHGMKPRFRADSEDVKRAILWDGTIINYTHPDLFERLGSPGSAVGLVVDDPTASALDAVRYLRGRGFEAAMIEDAEPGLPIVFVTTNALNNAVIVYRKHVLDMGVRPQPWR